MPEDNFYGILYAKRYLRAFRLVFDIRFDKESQAGDPEFRALYEFFRDNEQWHPINLLCLQVLAWSRIGVAKKNVNNDTVYHYGCCQNSRKILHVLKYIDDLARDTNTPKIRGWSYDVAVGNICRSLERQLEQEVTPEKAEQLLDGLEDKLVDIMRLNPAPANDEK